VNLRTDENDGFTEQLEHIPWSDLERREFPRWIAYAAAGAIAIAALGVALARSFGASPVPVEVSAVSAATTQPIVTTTLPVAAPLYSEADLMAVVPGSQEQLAAVRAEWFVRDYFGSGGRPQDAPGVIGALPKDATWASVGGSGVSYVEWAEAFRVEPAGGDLYRVGVVFGMLGGSDASTLSRLEPRAVDVVVAVDGDGVGVVDLPMPAEPPSGVDLSRWPEADPDVPQEVIDAATEQASLWGTEPEVVAATHGDAGWRVEVAVSDEAGNRWPLSVWLDGTEPMTTPPWGFTS
jgi:hypothetical protein